MAMDAATAAAVAALIVSILAMTVAFAQVVQQYLLTGQLIRICDSVVYGKMPGRGRRVWEFSQFRFRVVYSMPQISLRPSLWIDSLPHSSSFSKGHLPLPDLRHTSRGTQGNFRQALSRHSGQHQQSEYSATPGEASWVSFCRVAQNASGNDLFCELIDCDADRCPADLPVAPMQVSLRDIVVVAIMAGMRCTDASFEKKSLAMEGAAGTITTSWHPLLGAIVHFAPRNFGPPLRPESRIDEVLGLRIGDGSISSKWMARMWDVAVVAGRQYDLRDRKFYQDYEGHSWITLSRSRTMVKASAPKSFRSPSPVLSFRLRSVSPNQRFRRRRSSEASVRSRSLQATSSGFEDPVNARPILTPNQTNGRLDTDIPVLRNDGDWSFISDAEPSKSKSDVHPIQPPAETLTAKRRPPLPPGKAWYKYLAAFFSTVFDASPAKSHSKPSVADLESNSMMTASGPPVPQIPRGPAQRTDEDRERTIKSSSMLPLPQQFRSRPPRSNDMPKYFRKKLDGRALQEYIEEKRKHEETFSSLHGRLLLTWPEQAEDEFEMNVDAHGLDGWRKSVLHSKRERVISYVERWRTIVNNRRQEREERDMQDEWEIETYYSASRPSSVAPSESTRRSSPAAGRSVSRESRNLGRRGFGLHEHQDLQLRGRARTPRGFEGSQHRSPVSSVRKTSEKDSSHNKSGPGNAGRAIAYGDGAITTPRYPHTPEKADESYGNDKMSPDRRKGKLFVESIFEDSKNETPPTLQADTKDRQQPRRVRMFIPEHQITDATDYGSDKSWSSRESSVERARPDVESMTRGGMRGPQFKKDADEIISNEHGNAEGAVREKRPPRSEPPKSILKPPRERFPEDENPIREGVAPLRDRNTTKEGIPPEARWTKISRALVNPEALERAHERFEARSDYVIVLRVLTRDEIVRLAEITKLIRDARPNDSEEDEDEDEEEDDQSVYEAETRNESEASSADWSNRSILGSVESSRMSDSPVRISESEDGQTEPSVKSSHKSRQEQNAHMLSQDLGETALPSNPSLSLDANGRVFPPLQPLPRRASTRSDLSAAESSESDEDDWRTIGSQGTGRRSGDPLAVVGVTDSVPAAANKTQDSLKNGHMNWFWICQADVLPGYFATPWHSHFSESVCFGAVVTMLEALEYLTDDSTLRYVEKQPYCEDWVYQGKSSYPSYAINAMGGVIVSAKYSRVKFEVFKTKIPPIELLRSYEYQVNRSSLGGNTRAVVERLGELMGLDSWLSFCGRLPEIYDGRNNLLRSMPALVQKIMIDFEYEFSHLERTRTEGGLQIIKEMAELILRMLEKEMMSEEEQLFAIVAVLRAAKMALCVVYGPDTVKLREILVNDVQVHLV
ncbi:uncharacterized protein Z518_00255 [Rhinocladiella mackenziei CBS 650.93]|uniref:DUF8035 domain-containing protein n=1 Tax=Rhinocladiella mackenziei CBS 650.93 TaxID=1442369 RepID=A0A0D2J0I5_9EURO|nr:uncharacterized protein Z518_00255 [Rhinocladiella mackenziei CBS 650.93]KIX09176.1 hypothetical protein Z518_00255 [Rhinocladiella mackenziei CBS 650.93]